MWNAIYNQTYIPHIRELSYTIIETAFAGIQEAEEEFLRPARS